MHLYQIQEKIYLANNTSEASGGGQAGYALSNNNSAYTAAAEFRSYNYD